ncbi:MAG: hypothetical protein MK102_01235 [Fuerstiella sp.]|nr:hypothetical protein [Fuerstiella sp.]
MIAAIDFGCFAIRSAFRQDTDGAPITVYSERSEYIVLPNTERYRQLLDTHTVPHAECEDTVAVYGNQASQMRWLSRIPSAEIFNSGFVPSDDPPARQMLDLICAAILPPPDAASNLCVFTVPGTESRAKSQKFLSRLIRMRGYEPLAVSAAEVAMLAEGSDSSFSGISVVIGAETSEVSISRLGVSSSSVIIPVGAAWIDIELARQFNIHVFDETGNAWLDLEMVREWKHSTERNLRNSVGERERFLSRMYRAMLDRIAQAAHQLLSQPNVQSDLGTERLNVICCGGPTHIAGFASALTERFVDQDIAERIQSVRTVDQPELTVVRGLLISGELEARCRRHPGAAA